MGNQECCRGDFNYQNDRNQQKQNVFAYDQITLQKEKTKMEADDKTKVNNQILTDDQYQQQLNNNQNFEEEKNIQNVINIQNQQQPTQIQNKEQSLPQKNAQLFIKIEEISLCIIKSNFYNDRKILERWNFWQEKALEIEKKMKSDIDKIILKQKKVLDLNNLEQIKEEMQKQKKIATEFVVQSQQQELQQRQYLTKNIKQLNEENNSNNGNNSNELNELIEKCKLEKRKFEVLDSEAKKKKVFAEIIENKQKYDLQLIKLQLNSIKQFCKDVDSDTTQSIDQIQNFYEEFLNDLKFLAQKQIEMKQVFVDQQFLLSSLYIHTDLIKSVEEYYQLKIFLNIPKAQFRLLFKASEHGKNAQQFHEKCDNEGPTLILIKAFHAQYIFGGYAETSWKQSANGCIKDENAFLFSFKTNEKYPICFNQNLALCYKTYYGPCFGDEKEPDLLIQGNLKNCQCNLGLNYGNYKLNKMEKSKKHLQLCDRKYFDIEDYEIFQVLNN